VTFIMSQGDPVRRRLWVFDFDGTLSPLVPNRSAASLHPSCREMLEDLAAEPLERVAVLSSRALEDLVPRVPIPRIFLGGGSGLEWQIPGGGRVRPGKQAERKLEENRAQAFPQFEKMKVIPGVEVEDKLWSVAVHFRHASTEARGELSRLLEELTGHPFLRMFPGPEAVEVQLLRSVNKSLGVQKLCRFLKFDSSGSRLVYAGDDGNDAAAMRWVMSRKGVALVVGNRTKVPGARVLEGPHGLAMAVRKMAGLPSRTQRKRGREAISG